MAVYCSTELTCYPEKDMVCHAARDGPSCSAWWSVVQRVMVRRAARDGPSCSTWWFVVQHVHSNYCFMVFTVIFPSEYSYKLYVDGMWMQLLLFKRKSFQNLFSFGLLLTMKKNYVITKLVFWLKLILWGNFLFRINILIKFSLEGNILFWRYFTRRGISISCIQIMKKKYKMFEIYILKMHPLLKWQLSLLLHCIMWIIEQLTQSLRFLSEYRWSK
jgi:hypothetical protein